MMMKAGEKMASVEKLPSGNYRIRVFIGKDNDGKKHYKSFTHEDKKMVKLMAAEFETTKKESKKTNKLSVAEAIDEYISIKEKVLSPSTVVGYKTIRKNYFQKLMKENIYDLDQEKVQLAVNEDYFSGKSVKTLKNAHGLLTATLRYKKINLMLDTTFPQKKKTEINIPTREDIDTIMKEYENTDMELPFGLSVYLGLRRSELCALEWSDIDFKNKTVNISKALVITENGEYAIKPPKTKAGNRVLTLPDEALKLLEKYKEKEGKLTNIRSTIMWDRLNSTQKKLGIKHFRWHDLRHYTASVMLALNIPDKYAMQIMGHETDNMLKTVYQHTIPEEMKKVTESLNNYFKKN